MTYESEARDERDFVEKIERMLKSKLSPNLEGISRRDISTLDFKGKDAIREGDLVNGIIYKLTAALGYSSMHEYNEAGNQFGHVCQVLRKLGDNEMAVTAKQLEIKCYQKAGNIVEAEKESYFLEELKLRKSEGNLASLVDFDNSECRGDIAYRKKDFKEAIEYYRQAIRNVEGNEFDRIAQKINTAQTGMNSVKGYSQRLKR
ncbi:MAG: tetratricopeptide repeat protein [Candidatus Pacearchaeota archaeon]|jgi:tetratricopeptide (TPR) repeat protein